MKNKDLKDLEKWAQIVYIYPSLDRRDLSANERSCTRV